MARHDDRPYGLNRGPLDGSQGDGPEDGTFNLAASGAALGIDPDISGLTQDAGSHHAGPNAAPITQIVFIEGNVPDARLLAAGVAPGVRAVILDPAADGVVQIAAWLTSHDVTGLSSIDIVAHGADGQIALGAATLSSATLAQYQSELSAVGAALKPGGDIQIYGCDVGQDAAGVSFLDQLSAAAGGASVAAASHLVGAAAGGGSWTLDVNVGTATVTDPFTAAAEIAYPAELQANANPQLFFADYGTTASADNRIEGIGVTTAGALVSSSTVDVVNATNAPFVEALGVVVDAPLGKYFAVNQNSDVSFPTTNEIISGTVSAGGTPTVIYNPGLKNGAGNYASIEDLALDQAHSRLYFTQGDISGTTGNVPSGSGVYSIGLTGGASTLVVSGAYSPAYLALDTANNLVFFNDGNWGTANFLSSVANNEIAYGSLTPGGTEHSLTSQLSSALQTTLSARTTASGYTYLTNPLSGLAVNAATQTIYFTILDGSSASGSNNLIDSVHYTVSGGVVTLGAVTTLYSGANAGSPAAITIDPQNGVFYVEEVGSRSIGSPAFFAGIEEGSLTATNTTAVTQILTETGIVSGASALYNSQQMAFVSVPTVSAGATATYLQNGTSIAVDSAAILTNSDGQGLAGATVSITGGTASDVLSFTPVGSITGSYNSSTETLTLSGADSLADYQTAFQSVKFSTSGTFGARTLNFTPNSGLANGPVTTATINVTASETVTASGTIAYFGPAAMTLDAGLTVTDANAADTPTTASVVISNFVSGDTLAVGTPGGLTSSFSNGTLTLSGTASLTTYQTALDSVQFATNNTNLTQRVINWTTGSNGNLSNTGTSDVNVICFCPGTMILTPTGEVKVENLSVGDPVITFGNGTQRITWMGHGKVLATKGKRGAATPIIVRKHAFANNVPNYDLHVTKGHSFYFDGVLIPVEFLVNHKTILWDDKAQEVEIYHVELGTHDVLFANGAPAESYRDDGNRWLFQNANDGWDGPEKAHYAPVLTGGPVVDEVWRRLLERAGGGCTLPTTTDPDLHLVVNGVRVDAHEHRGMVHVFRLPGSPSSVRIVSREAVPTELGLSRDPRSLGVAIKRVVLAQGRRLSLIEADDERLTQGFHHYEPDDCLRWTKGDATLPIEAFSGFGSNALVELHLGGATTYPLFADAA